MKRIYLTILLSLYCFYAFPQFFYDETCRNGYGVFTPNTRHTHTSSNYYQGGNYAAYVEGGSGNGWLRLTLDGGTYAIGYVQTDMSYSSNLGLVIEFDFKVYGLGTIRTNPVVNISGVADGFSVFLFNGNTTLTNYNLGYSGGALGYLPWASAPGLSGAYLGVGIDEYGNFHQIAYRGTIDQASYLLPRAVTVVGGQGNSFGYLGHYQYSSSNQHWVSGTSTRPSDATKYRRLRIQIDPRSPSGMIVNVYMKESASGNTWTQIVNNVAYPTAAPSTLKVGLASAVGGATGTHEIRDVIIRTSGNLSLFKNMPDPGSCLLFGQNFDIRTILTNGDNTARNNIGIRDTLPAGYVPTGTPTISGGSFVSTPTYSTLGDGRRVYTYYVNLPQLATATITFRGAVSLGYPAGISSGATIFQLPTGGFVDNNLNDNTSSVVYNIFNGGAVGSNQTICSGATPARLTSTTNPNGGTGSYSYNWQQSPNGTGSWTNADGTRNQLYYDPPALSTTTYYRRITTNTCGTDYSNVVEIAVAPALNPGVIATDQGISSGQTPASLTSTTTASGGSGAISYNWQQSTDGSSWVDATGTRNQITYSPPALTATTYYRRGASNVCGPVYTTPVTITVSSCATASDISVPTTTICSGETAALSASSITLSNPVTYRWYSSQTSTTALFTGSTFTTPVLTANTTYYVSAQDASHCENALNDRTPVNVTVKPLATPDMIKITVN